jgi:very-short-patch-repair endonuclease
LDSKIRSPKYVIELAREMRVHLTETEKILWEELRNKKIDGKRFRIQHPIHRYILDFYCHEKKLAVEVDGDVHKNRKDYDEFRDEFLKSIGIITLRVTNEDVANDINYVLSEIRKGLNHEIL